MATMYIRNKTVKRSEGQSVVAALAYRAGRNLSDHRTGVDHDYSPLRERVLSERMHWPDDVRSTVHDTMDLEAFANRLEQAETTHSTRPDQAMVARKFPVALPHELDQSEREELLGAFVRFQLVEPYDVPVHVSYHPPHPGEDHDHRNVHAHLVFPERGMTPSGEFRENKIRTFTKKKWYQEFRADWARAVNRKLEQERIPDRIHPNGSSPGLPDRIHLGPNRAHSPGTSDAKRWNQTIDQLEALMEAKLGEDARAHLMRRVELMQDLHPEHEEFHRVSEAIEEAYDQYVGSGRDAPARPDQPEAGVEHSGSADDFKRTLVQQYYDQPAAHLPEEITYMNASTGTLVLGSGTTIRHRILEDGRQRITVDDPADQAAVDFLLREFDERLGEDRTLELFGSEAFKQRALDRYHDLVEEDSLEAMTLRDRETGERLVDPTRKTSRDDSREETTPQSSRPDPEPTDPTPREDEPEGKSREEVDDAKRSRSDPPGESEPTRVDRSAEDPEASGYSVEEYDLEDPQQKQNYVNNRPPDWTPEKDPERSSAQESDRTDSTRRDKPARSDADDEGRDYTVEDYNLEDPQQKQNYLNNRPPDWTPEQDPDRIDADEPSRSDSPSRADREDTEDGPERSR